MSVVFSKDQLSKAWGIVAPVAKGRTTTPILSYVLLTVGGGKPCTLTATDNNQTVIVEVKAEQVTEPMVILLPSQRFSQVIAAAGETIDIAMSKDGVKVKTGRSVFNLATENPDNFPVRTDQESSLSYAVSTIALREAIRRTIYATDPASAKFALGGVIFDVDDQLNLAATDGKRISICSVGVGSVDGDTSVTSIVPAESLRSVQRVIADVDDDCTIETSGNYVTFRTAGRVFHSRLLEGRFPRWRDVIPSDWRERPTTTVLAGDLLSVVNSAKITTSEESCGVRFTFADGVMSLKSQASGVGTSGIEMPIAWAGPAVSVELNPNLLDDIAKSVDATTQLTLHVKDDSSPFLIQSQDGLQAVVMPLKRD
jgi:DNA polymerase III subunit beta